MMKKFPLSLIATIFLFASCANMFQGKVDMPRSGTNVSLYRLVGGKEEIEQLEPPSEIFVSVYDYSDKIKISWTPVDYAYSYRLERAVVTEKDDAGNFIEPDESEFELLEHSSALVSTNYIDYVIKDDANDPLDYTNPKYSSAYFYRVSAENSIAGYDSSEYKTSTIAMLLPPPTNVKASMGASATTIKVSWQKAAGAVRYEVYRGEASDGSNSRRVAQLAASASSFDDVIDASFQGKELYYSVVAISSNGSKSVNSSVALGYTLLDGAPPSIQGVKITKGRGECKPSEGITVSWTPVSGDIKYVVYRSSSVDSSLTKLKDGIESSTSSYNDTRGLKPNVYYYYYVQAYKTESDGSINRGPMSDSGEESASPVEGFILSSPENVSVIKERQENGSSICYIKFSAAIGDDSFANDSKKYSDYKTYVYVVLGSETSTGTFSEIATLENSVSATGGFYTAQVASYKYYKIKTRNDTAESAESSVVAPAPYRATEVYVTRAGKIEGYTNNDAKANANGVHAVRITWQAPADGAEGGYYIYRSTKQDSGFRKITENPVTETSYIDFCETAKAGVIYYYQVLSLNSLGQGANYSIVDKPVVENGFIKISEDGTPYGRGFGWGALTPYQYMREYIKTTLGSQKKLTLMHKSLSTDKLGSETAYGAISGSLSYNATLSGINGRVIMHYTNYADYYISNNKDLGIYFHLEGDTNTKANASADGTMDGTVTVKGMYPGSVCYDNIEIKGGAARGGTYGITRAEIDSNKVEISWQAGEK